MVTETRILETRTVKCPVCNRGRLIEVTKNVEPWKISVYQPSLIAKAEWFIKCPVCKSQIGLSIAHYQ